LGESRQLTDRYYQVPHPIAAILALTQLMQVSTGKLPLQLNTVHRENKI
jgi:hypothetical protein